MCIFKILWELYFSNCDRNRISHRVQEQDAKVKIIVSVWYLLFWERVRY